MYCRVTLEAEDSATYEPLTGVFRTAPTGPADIKLQWSADVAGQGYGINPDLGGIRIYSTMAARDPHLVLHSRRAVGS